MDLVSLSNPLSFEGVLSDISEDNGEETPLKKAQDIMYDALEVTDPKRRVALAPQGTRNLTGLRGCLCASCGGDRELANRGIESLQARG